VRASVALQLSNCTVVYVVIKFVNTNILQVMHSNALNILSILWLVYMTVTWLYVLAVFDNTCEINGKSQWGQEYRPEYIVCDSLKPSEERSA
jgi:hypothetical protein